MSGKRCKALRREFKKRTGCAPETAVVSITMRATFWLRRIKGILTKERIEVPTLRVISPSEWRQVKKAYLRQRRAA